MDINELESFKMSDAVKFHDELNPNLWINSKLDPEVKDQLLVIAEDFVSTLGINDLDIVDITISGSNAAYSYTPHSDLDLHVLVDMSRLRDEIYRELFTAKKTLYNDSHDITVHGVPVELYVQDVNEPVKSLGEYSVLDDKWIRIPKRERANFDEVATKAKFENLAEIVELALATRDLERVEKTLNTIKRYRKAGLAKGGEFGPENLAFKAIRKQGGIQELYDLRNELRSKKLSIEEEHKILNKPTLSVAELAEKHGVSRLEIAKQLDKGIKVELEHTNDKSVAKEIASDHIAEDPRYYDKLNTLGLEESVSNIADTIKSSLGLKQFIVTERGDDLILDSLIVGKENQGKGLGTIAMKQLIDYADQNGKRIILTPGLQNKTHGTTSRARLVKFYKSLGFKENKGRSIDFAMGAGKMYRDPSQAQLDETTQENQIVNVVSRTAADKIVNIMQKNEGKIMSILQAGMTPKTNLTLFGLKPKDLNVPKVNDPLLYQLLQTMNIKINTTKNWDNENDVKVHGTYYVGDNEIELWFPAHELAAKLRGSSLQSEIANTLSHEIQHALDDLKSQGKALQDPASFKGFSKDYQAYLKRPYEVNARFQQATMDLAKHIAMPKKDGSKTTQKDLPELIRYAFEKNRLDKIYEKNQPEYKRLLSRAYKFFQAELNAPKKATPQNIVKRAVNWIMGNPTKEINEASGYIPSAKEKNDPRFKTALTVDVKPDSIKKNAKAFNWKTSRAGIPPQANPNGKIAEDLMNAWKSFLAEGEEQQELFPGYDKEHRQKRMDDWLQSTHAWDGHKPITFYHATTKDFNTFNTHSTGFASALGMAFEVERHGSFFAVDPKFAETFIEDPNTREYKPGGRVIPVHLSVQNPIDLRDNSLSHMLSNEETVEGFKANDIDLRSIYYHVYQDDRWELFDGPEGGEFVENLQKLGFDGAIINESIPNDSNARSGEVWVVFKPNQVKAIHNRGSYSPDDPNMMKENITEGMSDDLFRRYGGKMMEFNALPAPAQKAVHHYMTVDGDRPEYADELVFGYAMIPIEALIKVCMQAPYNDLDSYDTWDDYHSDYWSSEDDRDYANHLKELWPVILDDEEGINDGWHRLHWYYRNGVKQVPAILIKERG